MSRNAALACRKLRFLRSRRSYPGSPRAVRVIETHFAWVFLAGHGAYKLKKPLRRGVMDYRSLASRARGCRNELRLNRRLAPHVYLDQVPLSALPDGSLRFGAGGRVVDWLVRMRRLPVARMLDHRASGAGVARQELNGLVALLAQFYRRARRRPLDRARYLRALRADIEQTGRALCAPELRLEAPLAQRAVRRLLQFIDGHGRLLGARARRLLDAHGDLRPEHVFLGTPTEPACIIDCLEFSAALRRLDPFEELAFLSLECGLLGAPRIGRELLRGVGRALRDEVPDSLVDFYAGRRALTRARVAAWNLNDPALRRHHRHWRGRARRYLELALRLSERAVREGPSGRWDQGAGHAG